MKRNFYQVVFAAAMSVAMFFLSQGCTPDPVKTCKCCQSPVVTKWYRNSVDTAKRDSIVIYNAFTPNSVPFCDSIVPEYDDMGNKIPRTPNLCRPNIDTVWNDSVNEYFYIKGIEKFENQLFIRIPGDTTKVGEFRNYSNTTFKKAVFDGQIHDSTLWNHERLRQLASKSFEYELVLYKDNKRKDTLDRIIGTVCLIRNNTDCEVSGCTGHQMPDKLLK